MAWPQPTPPAPAVNKNELTPILHANSTRRTFEAGASGALLFQEAGHQELPGVFQDRRECVYYTADDLEFLLEHYLEHEDERRAIAATARERVREFQFEPLWETALASVEREWDGLVAGARKRPRQRRRDELLTRTWQAVAAPPRGDSHLLRDLEAALKADPQAAELHNALGVAVGRLPVDGRTAQATAETAMGCFRRAVEARPADVLARSNLAEALALAGQTAEAADQARHALATLAGLPELDAAGLDGALFRGDFGPLAVAWERAGWENAGQPAAEAQAKHRLLRWRLHVLLARLTGDLVHSYEAMLARPELPASPAALGCTLATKGYAGEALPHLRRALEENPLDRDAARALFHCLGATGDYQGQAALAEDHRLLSKAAPQLVPAEPWFVGPAPSGNELVSVIVLCCNEVEYTRLCLESVWRHTRAPYELIVVDNASTDGTPEYLEELRARVGRARGNGHAGNGQPPGGPVRVEVIRNEKNVGFPAGCNQGINQARGRYLLFLNNDTVVTSGWLEGLVAGALHEWPAVGMVGPVTNYAPDAQGVRPDYELPLPQSPAPAADKNDPPSAAAEGTSGMEAFAARRRREFGGRLLDVRRLTGFCLLVRREVFERAGAFDERYGLGFFDDDDLCVRAREAGFRLVVAPGVYLHHFGSRTFRGLGVENRGQLLRSVEDGVRGYRTRHFLAGLYRQQRRDAEAEVQLRAAAAEWPGFVPAWLLLADLLIDHGRWEAAEAAADALAKCGASEAALVRARAHLLRKQFGAAREVLGRHTAAAPADVRGWVLLSHVLLQENKDPEAAERALRAVLERDPDNAEARQNLGVLLRVKNPELVGTFG